MALGVPFQSPPSRQAIAALMQRQRAQRMAAGGQPTYVAPQNPSVATPYTGDMNTYGEGPEHDFFPTPTPAPNPSGGGGGGGSGGSGGGSNGSGGGSNGSFNGGFNGFPNGGTGGYGSDTAAGIDTIAQSLGKNPAELLRTSYAGQPANRTAAEKDAPQATYSYPVNAQGQTSGQFHGLQGLGLLPAGPFTPAPAPTPAPQQPYRPPAFQQLLQPQNQQPPAPAQQSQPSSQNQSGGLTSYLHSLQGYRAPTGGGASPRNRARGGRMQRFAAGGTPTPDPSAVVAKPLENVRNIQQRGEQPAGGPSQGNFTGRDFANANVAVSPSLKSAIGIGSMVAGLAAGPAIGALSAIGKMAFGSDPFNVPGPRLPADELNSVANTMDQGFIGRNLTGALPAASRELSSDRAAAIQGNNTPIGGYGQTTPNAATHGYGGVEATGNFTSPGFNGAGAGAGAGNANAGGGGGGTGRGDYGGSGEPDKGGLYRRGGGVRRYDDGGSSQADDSGAPDYAQQQAQAAAQQQQQNAAPTTEEYLADPASAYMAMMLNTARGTPGPLPMTAVGYRHAKGGRIQRYDGGGDVNASDSANSDAVVRDPNDASSVAPQTSGGGVPSQWLPLLAGSFSATQGDPYASAASIGVATQMMGGTPQDAMDAARLLYKSGAAGVPKAPQKSFDPQRDTTSSLLSALATQAGVANQLRMAQLDPTTSMSTQPQPYTKPAVRGSQVLKATGGLVQGEHPDGILSDGNSYAVKGPGSGQSDDINAKLSNDEHVIDATTVAALGDGSSDEGHRRLDKMREMIRAKAGLKNPKKIMGKQPEVHSILARVSGGRV